VNWAWLQRNAQQILTWTLEHVWLAAAPTVLGLLLALPLGAIAHRYRWSYATLITLAGLLYTIPSLALFVVLPGLMGTRILDPVNVVVALCTRWRCWSGWSPTRWTRCRRWWWPVPPPWATGRCGRC
jgi:osmoprotectant transport system permease protein